MNKSYKERWFILALCLLAAIRVFVYAAAFPFFGNVEEWTHFDLVMKYSHGHVPRSIETVSPEAATYIATYSSPEYFKKQENFPDKRVPTPLWKQDQKQVQPAIDKGIAFWSSAVNYEATQPPLYYMAAGLWTRIGALSGLRGAWLLYWIRFLNILLAAALVWIAYKAASGLFPDKRFVTMGVAMLAAFVPQDAFYTIQNDVLSPVCFGLAFIGLTGFMRAGVPGRKLSILTGLAIAATVLVKTSNLALLAVVFVFLLFRIYRLIKTRTFKQAVPSLVWFAVCMLTPVFIWFAWNLSNSLDITASEGKVLFFGWTHKYLVDYFHHPIFTLRGVWLYWALLMTGLWRGELVWSFAQLGMPQVDIFYWASSFILLIVAAIFIHRSPDPLQRGMNRMALWSFLSLIFFLIVLSLSFNFGACFYPSQTYPYFAAGRLISAALIPFLVLYVQGFNRILFWIKSERIRFFILVAIVIAITLTEIIISSPVFSSSYNFYHL